MVVGWRSSPERRLRSPAEEVVGMWRWRGWLRSYLGVLSVVAKEVVSEVEVVEVVAEEVVSAGGRRVEEEKRFEEFGRLGDMSAWGRGEEEVKCEKLFRKTNELQTSNVCAHLRDADISAKSATSGQKTNTIFVNIF
ncbi:hypothetical protein HanRHA438_Chr04g0151561 [Helianthus annuus]|uniref:Uncharacterized protein n=1 Tax=Helianthus annuus TaxID=4232 RepID=A0A251UW66_HELAN|nr:hypothetical protein HanXRQr2_Chr04g0140101 [Helianthus annuus]KAJ0586410.1 hypothetical protein HanIR_Chr04g0151611 [Helianthus annuus]KAJ0595160.1 hypothetical protein HanHA89_Chr04g0128321 [Helianthus annuus]KAJ0924712.1 hypothetical protein HanRHA438_Chr04g0151561 [Helianthus annuus]